MAGTTTETIEYNDLTDELRDKVREHFRNNEELVPYDWYEYEFEYITEKYGKQIEIDDRTINIEPYNGDYSWAGTVDFDSVANRKFIPAKFYEYMKKEWVYDVSNSFKDEEMVHKDDFTIDTNLLNVDVETAFFGDLTKNDFKDDVVEVSISDFKPRLEKAVAEYGKYGKYVEEKVAEWLQAMEVAETIFFQSTSEIDIEGYMTIPDEVVYSLELEIDQFMNGPFYDSLDTFVSNIYDELRKKLQASYEYYFSDEHVDESLEQMSYVVDIDENGNQLDIVDLRGKYE